MLTQLTSLLGLTQSPQASDAQTPEKGDTQFSDIFAELGNDASGARPERNPAEAVKSTEAPATDEPTDVPDESIPETSEDDVDLTRIEAPDVVEEHSSDLPLKFFGGETSESPETRKPVPDAEPPKAEMVQPKERNDAAARPARAESGIALKVAAQATTDLPSKGVPPAPEKSAESLPLQMSQVARPVKVPPIATVEPSEVATAPAVRAARHKQVAEVDIIAPPPAPRMAVSTLVGQPNPAAAATGTATVEPKQNAIPVLAAKELKPWTAGLQSAPKAKTLPLMASAAKMPSVPAPSVAEGAPDGTPKVTPIAQDMPINAPKFALSETDPVNQPKPQSVERSVAGPVTVPQLVPQSAAKTDTKNVGAALPDLAQLVSEMESIEAKQPIGPRTEPRAKALESRGQLGEVSVRITSEPRASGASSKVHTPESTTRAVVDTQSLPAADPQAPERTASEAPYTDKPRTVARPISVERAEKPSEPVRTTRTTVPESPTPLAETEVEQAAPTPRTSEPRDLPLPDMPREPHKAVRADEARPTPLRVTEPAQARTEVQVHPQNGTSVHTPALESEADAQVFVTRSSESREWIAAEKPTKIEPRTQANAFLAGLGSDDVAETVAKERPVPAAARTNEIEIKVKDVTPEVRSAVAATSTDPGRPSPTVPQPVVAQERELPTQSPISPRSPQADGDILDDAEEVFVTRKATRPADPIVPQKPVQPNAPALEAKVTDAIHPRELIRKERETQVAMPMAASVSNAKAPEMAAVTVPIQAIAPEMTQSRGRVNAPTLFEVTEEEGVEFTTISAPSDARGPSASAQIHPATPNTPATSAQVIRQITEAVARMTEDRIEIRLNPEELGQVRLQLVHSDQGMTVNIQADRQETLDLMRRHIDQLSRDLADAGFEGAGFSFGDDARDGQKPGARSVSAPEHVEDPTPANAPKSAAQDGLDILI
ncbi:flagellar hook-length control protein FliK [Tropicibacter naphthalenivorans]|uniref:Flagellar hook-length control protein FliK n=1 Tax=Tropicibacter naphthalenivorans TaxID=441103 RepID=A0A0P1GE59_9RHOB|nr:flagellar hook-length control protein FliK [Tropicibacter naphthalenivorans]CUH79736.1 Flagellar hook-length control protein FliK [Tropicibacter naphthalenivorans]SMC74858.1 hook-length control protein FliK [Tropicibacter naphthalenivorans]